MAPEMSTENQAPEPRRPILAVNYPKVTAAPEVRWLDSQYYSGAIVDFGDAQMHIFSPEQADSLIEAFTQARALFAAHEPPLIAPAEDVSMALAEHTQPAIEAIEQAAKPPHFIDEQGYCAACDWELKASVQADPFAGIPNSSDEENRPL